MKFGQLLYFITIPVKHPDDGGRNSDRNMLVNINTR